MPIAQLNIQEAGEEAEGGGGIGGKWKVEKHGLMVAGRECGV